AADRPVTAESTMDAARTEQRRAGPVVAAAVAVVLVAAVGGYLGLRSAPDDLEPKKGASQATVPTATASQASPSASPSASASAEPSASQPPSPTATPTPEKEKEEEKNPLPAGWKMYKDKKLGFSVGLPKGWDVLTRNGKQVRFRGPGAASNAYLMIEDGGKSSKDPYDDWKKQEPTLKRPFGGYKKLDIKRVKGFHKAAADWDFTWVTNTGKTRVRNRGFITENGRAYAIYWHTLRSHWKADYDFFEGFCATFEPAK
ncbi:hypothetical protein PW035_63445, partial [Nonomuraea angiospora]|nr:hypothetical protein [Nonomuraea angiospora]